MVPFEVGEQWLIARKPHTVHSKSIKGTRTHSASRDEYVHGGCWTGEKWAQQTSFAMMFDSRVEAAEYLEQNRKTINAA